ncbi:Rieske 2Fe-2S domain-containing protein [Halobacterium bonnevillei]|uniref:Rieske 2Fe-2S domain-containing protein n=1 Tax=Halobacterium bonnevillei TaxID=2692200 RepID=A0A6B0SIZ5_9EURY|nr:Rieske 2Fe-2S domain-containing protein [Halobacterium bonnevillei]MXR21137.1 Rieske 2Fe-2S domain-containing protein [Halobacterium bonnevillei]
MSDKYPESSGRRRFVKGVVGSAAVAGVGTASIAAVDAITNPTGAGGGSTQYFGVENTAGPAPRAMPMVPLETDEEGYLRGVYPEIKEEEQAGQTVQVAREELGGITYEIDWFQYCGVQEYQGLQPSYDGDNYFRYTGGSTYDWQPSSGRMHVDDFDDYESWANDYGEAGIGKPAKGTWRSQDTDNNIPVQIIRSSVLEDKIAEESGEAIDWLEAATEDGFMAILNKCTHFCCAPSGFRSSNYGGAGDKIYCQCHQSIYDPYSIVKRRFVAFPRPEDG